MKIAVIGTGYVGLVTGTCFAETGNDVICVDIDANKVEKMRNGIVPIYEPHLDVLFERNIKQGLVLYFFQKVHLNVVRKWVLFHFSFFLLCWHQYLHKLHRYQFRQNKFL